MRHKKIHPVKSNRVEAIFNKVKLSVILLFALGLTGLQAQESVNTTGGNALGSGGTVSYTVGQTVYQSHTGSNGSVEEGVQQPYEISVVTGIELTAISLMITAYPNPTTNYLTLSIDGDVKTSHNLSLMSYQLFDMYGKLLKSEKIEGSETSIAMSNLVSATYFVKVIQDQREVKTFKIIKK